jgi:hypothetical protein
MRGDSLAMILWWAAASASARRRSIIARWTVPGTNGVGAMVQVSVTGMGCTHSSHLTANSSQAAFAQGIGAGTVQWVNLGRVSLGARHRPTMFHAEHSTAA